MSKENIKVRVFRDNPFCWQNKRTLRLIQKNYKGQKLTSRTAVYTVLTQIASDSSAEEYETWGIKIMEMSGVGYTTLRNIFNEFEEMGILKREQERTSKGTYGSLKVILLEPFMTDSQSKPNGKVDAKANDKECVSDSQSKEDNSEFKKENIENNKEVASDLTEKYSFETGNGKIISEKQIRYQEAVNMIAYMEKFLKMPMPDSIIYVPIKKGGTREVDLNIQAGKRLIKKYGKEKIELLIRLFFELKTDISQNEKKYVPLAENMAYFEKNMSKVFRFIENQGIDPHSGKRFKQAKPHTDWDEAFKGKIIRKDKW